MKKRFLRILIIGVFIALIAAYNYNHLKDADVDTIHIVTLLICGAGIGMFLVSISGLFFWKKD